MRWRPTTTRTSPEAGDLYVFYENGYVPRAAKQGQSITVNRPSAISARRTGPCPGRYDGTAVDTLAWQSRAGRLGHGHHGRRRRVPGGPHERATELLKLARAVQGSTGAPLAVPFSMTYLPADLYPDGAQSSTASRCSGRSGWATGAPGPRPTSTTSAQTLTVTVSEGFPVCGPSQRGDERDAVRRRRRARIPSRREGVRGRRRTAPTDTNGGGRSSREPYFAVISAATLAQDPRHINTGPEPRRPRGRGSTLRPPSPLSAMGFSSSPTSWRARADPAGRAAVRCIVLAFVSLAVSDRGMRLEADT